MFSDGGCWHRSFRGWSLHGQGHSTASSCEDIAAALSCEDGPGLAGVCGNWNDVAGAATRAGSTGDLERGAAVATEAEGSGLTRGLMFASIVGLLLFVARRVLGRRGGRGRDTHRSAA